MKRLLLLPVCSLFVLLGLCGCQGPDVDENGVVGDDGRLPQFLAGAWKADASNWQITLTPDGKVKSVVNAGGLSMDITKGWLLQEGHVEGAFLYFDFGPCFANYEPATRELSVTVTIDYFHMQLPSGALEGDMKHDFTGPVSKDSRRWNAELMTYAKPKGLQPTDPNLIEPEFFVFKKVDSNQPSSPKNQ